ncbi:uncharacterized protein FOMMEDRAFT_152978 [Fomitiporia mediterranea MF3/22]|uniref:uncharacterized protein n=1 Tax=Fomitiporia mediterranea (strain MF3/22) TaxID=694068 RepID=UPI0004408E96|nr:uncharacterized protein FOMMEDRAFT_152978 [Fomitiporia mediterranea MF3/22]EJD05646.1 hypothetical protein FOMMEDRAFT_152978 [Fomitiporia mediterranea MF3/22]
MLSTTSLHHPSLLSSLLHDAVSDCLSQMNLVLAPVDTHAKEGRPSVPPGGPSHIFHTRWADPLTDQADVLLHENNPRGTASGPGSSFTSSLSVSGTPDSAT